MGTPLPVGWPALRGLILAGGHSRRLGQDKAALVLSGQTLLDRMVELLQPVTVSVHVSVRPEQAGDPVRRGHALLVDPAPDLGPAAGFLAAQAFDPAAAWLVVACDMPGVGPAHLAALLRARVAGRGGTAFRSPGDGEPEPLCAIWEPATLARLAARAGRSTGGQTADGPGPRSILAGADPVLLDPPDRFFLASLNTPADLRRYWNLKHGQEPQEDRG